MSRRRPQLRACPFCKSDGEDNIYFSEEVVICTDSEFTCGYTVRCINCGTSICDEYKDEVVRLWNGADKPSDEDDEGDAE